jgi:hypothetical protein
MTEEFEPQQETQQQLEITGANLLYNGISCFFSSDETTYCEPDLTSLGAKLDRLESQVQCNTNAIGANAQSLEALSAKVSKNAKDLDDNYHIMRMLVSRLLPGPTIEQFGAHSCERCAKRASECRPPRLNSNRVYPQLDPATDMDEFEIFFDTSKGLTKHELRQAALRYCVIADVSNVPKEKKKTPVCCTVPGCTTTKTKPILYSNFMRHFMRHFVVYKSALN